MGIVSKRSGHFALIGDELYRRVNCDLFPVVSLFLLLLSERVRPREAILQISFVETYFFRCSFAFEADMIKILDSKGSVETVLCIHVAVDGQ
jgi:hypothetical protein